MIGTTRRLLRTRCWTSRYHVKEKVKWSRYGPGVAQRMGRGIALLFHDRGIRRGWVVSSTPRPHLPPGKTQYPFYRRLGGPQGRSGRVENLFPTGIRSRTFQPAAQSLYRLSYSAHIQVPCKTRKIKIECQLIQSDSVWWYFSIEKRGFKMPLYGSAKWACAVTLYIRACRHVFRWVRTACRRTCDVSAVQWIKLVFILIYS